MRSRKETGKQEKKINSQHESCEVQAIANELQFDSEDGSLGIERHDVSKKGEVIADAHGISKSQ